MRACGQAGDSKGFTRLLVENRIGKGVALQAWREGQRVRSINDKAMGAARSSSKE
jgi:hypothetical protein